MSISLCQQVPTKPSLYKVLCLDFDVTAAGSCADASCFWWFTDESPGLPVSVLQDLGVAGITWLCWNWLVCASILRSGFNWRLEHTFQHSLYCGLDVDVTAVGSCADASCFCWFIDQESPGLPAWLCTVRCRCSWNNPIVLDLVDSCVDHPRGRLHFEIYLVASCNHGTTSNPFYILQQAIKGTDRLTSCSSRTNIAAYSPTPCWASVLLCSHVFCLILYNTVTLFLARAWKGNNLCWTTATVCREC